MLPIYLHELKDVPSLQIIAHRIVWSCFFILAFMLLRGQLGTLRQILSQPPLLGRLVITALLITTNWLVYVWAVTHGHIVETSLGYYINPLMNVVLGIFFLHERLNRDPVDGGGAGGDRRRLPHLRGRQAAVDRDDPGLELFALWADAQGDERRGAAGACHRDPGAAAGRGRLPALVRARRRAVPSGTHPWRSTRCWSAPGW